jgi:phosphatidylglycerophosphate synthase
MNKFFTKIAKKNILVYWLSLLSYTLSVALSKTKISPNQITFFSLIFCIISFYFLIIQDLEYFIFFYIVSVILDLCDGQVARIKNKINKSILNFDHLSDIFKISLILLGIGIFYNLEIIWILSYVTNFLFLFLMLLHQIIIDINKKVTIKKIREYVPIINVFFKINFLKKFFDLWYNAFFTVSLFTTLLFVVIPQNYTLAISVFIYLILLLSLNIIKNLKKISKVVIK